MSHKTLLSIFFYFAAAGTSMAAVSLSINPIDGSNHLRFDRTAVAGEENKKEIHIRVNSPNGERYQVFQRVLEPITNEQGDSLNLQAITTQSLPNSNSSGTLYLQNSDHLSMGDQLLYSSSPSGVGDSFIVGYDLAPSQAGANGSFRGRLVFTLRNLSGGPGDEVTIDVFLDISSTFKLSFKGGHEMKAVHVHSTDISEETADFVDFSFSGNAGQEIKVYQDTETYPENETQDELGPGILQIDPQGQTDGLRVPGPTALKQERTLIYSSSKDQDEVIIYFLVDADQLKNQEAGKFRGRIKYEVQTGQGTQEFPIDVRLDVPPVFSINVITPPGGVNFTHVLSDTPPQEKEVVVTVQSNLHKPYQVIQGLDANMTNSQGKEFDSKYFTQQVEIPPDQHGQSDYIESTPVKTGEYPVFSSDANGSGATFKVLYKLQGYPQMSPGDFMAPIRLSLNQK